MYIQKANVIISICLHLLKKDNLDILTMTASNSTVRESGGFFWKSGGSSIVIHYLEFTLTRFL